MLCRFWSLSNNVEWVNEMPVYISNMTWKWRQFHTVLVIPHTWFCKLPLKIMPNPILKHAYLNTWIPQISGRNGCWCWFESLVSLRDTGIGETMNIIAKCIFLLKIKRSESWDSCCMGNLQWKFAKSSVWNFQHCVELPSSPLSIFP